MKYPSFNILKRDRISSYSLSHDGTIDYRNHLVNKSLNYLGNEEDIENEYLYHNFNNNMLNGDYYQTKELLKFAKDLYKKNYITHSLERKLKKLIKENNKEVLSILNPYLNIHSHRNYDELAKMIKPVITSGSQKSEILEESKQNSSSSENNNNKNNKKEKKSKRKNNTKKNTSKKKVKLSDEEKILEDIKLNFTKEKYLKLKGLLEKKDKEIIKIIKNFVKNNDYNHLLSKLSRLVENVSDNSDDNDEDNISEKDNENDNENENENDSSYYIRNDDSEKKNKNDKNKKKNKNKLESEEIQKISKNIYNSFKNKGKDIFYIAKYDLQKLKNDEKISLFTKQFKLNLDKIKKDNYKIPKKNISIIKNYYTDYIVKNICKNFNDDEKLIYEHLIEEDEENNIILQHFKELLAHQNINELINQIKSTIKEAEERIEEEENEDDDEDNKGKNSIKEENEENEDEEEEEEEDGEGEEDEEGEEEDDDNKDSENKSKNNSSSNKDNFILKDANKDRAVNILNNNYRKINNFSNFSNLVNNNNNNQENGNNNDNYKDEKKYINDNNQNLGLGFVVVKQKKPIKEEEKKDSNNNFQININNNNNNDNKLNTTHSLAKESSQSTNNPNKKLNQFITQIEHLKKIDDIKKTIIDAIHDNNKYVMDLFQKFQKNKFNLNPKSLYAVYKQIIDNPDTESKDYIFKSLIKEAPNINEDIQEFLIEEFTNKNAELETYYSLYKQNKEKDDFIESIQIFLNKTSTKKLLIKYCLKKINSEDLLKKNENDNNEEVVHKSKEIIKKLHKYNIFNEKEYNIIMNSLDNDDDVFSAVFHVLFDNQDLNDFYETMNLALENQMKKNGNSGGNIDNWNNDLIKKNYKEIKKKIEEKHYDTLEGLYKNKNENLYNILKDLNSSNLNEKIENVKTLILKKELSAT